MNKKEKKELRTCTKKGLIKLINDPRYVSNKAMQFPAIVGYLARHGINPANKDSFMDLVYTARSELLAQEAKLHAKAGKDFPYDRLAGLNGPSEARVKAFIKNPVEAINKEMVALCNRKENLEAIDDPDEIQYLSDLKTSANILAIETTISGNQDKMRYEDRAEMIDVVNRLGKKMPEADKDLDASLKRVNSGFFGTLFRRRSKEYKAFEESFKTFRDPKMALSGNTADLQKNTEAYLKHLIPDFKYGEDMPVERWLSALPKGQRARAGFCLDLLDSIHESKAMKPYMDNVVNGVNGKPIVNVAPIKKEESDEIKQESFQQNLIKDTSLEPAEEKPVDVKEGRPIEPKQKEPAGMSENDLEI